MNFFSKNQALATLFFTIFLDMLGVGLLIPIMPFLFTDPTSPHYLLGSGVSQNAGYILVGIIASIHSLGMFLSAPLMGEFSDKVGRKKLLAMAMAGNALGYLVFAWGIASHSLILVIVGRVMNGITSGSMVVAQAAIADVTTPENRSKNFGLIGAAFGLGMVLGPVVGGKLVDSSLVSWFSGTTPFFFSAVLSGLNVLLLLLFFKETNPHIDPNQKLTLLKAVRNIKHAITLKSLRPLFITNFLFQGGISFYMTFVGVFFIERFHFTEANIGNYFAYIGIWIIFTQTILTRVLSKYFSEKQILQNTLLVIGCVILAIASLHDVKMLFFVAPFMAMGMGLTMANMMALISRSAEADMQGEAMGINGSVSSLAMAIPPLFAGAIAALFSAHTPLMIASGIVVFSGLYFINHIHSLRLRDNQAQ